MNIYDTANKLASEIRESEEYANYKMAKQVINMKQDLKEKVEKFEKDRYNLQIEIMQTGKNDENKMKEIQNSYAQLIENQEAKSFLEAEAKFNIVITDINKIIGESIKDVVQ